MRTTELPSALCLGYPECLGDFSVRCLCVAQSLEDWVEHRVEDCRALRDIDRAEVHQGS